MNIVSLLFIVTLPLAGYSQKTVITYYDLKHTQKHETYITDSYGVKNGNYTEYSEFGGILTQGTYKSNEKVGKWTYKDDKGKLALEENYDNNGKFSGQVIHYIGGNMSDMYHYKHGIKYGTCKRWYSANDYGDADINGDKIYLNKEGKTQLYYEENYKNDMLDSSRTEYYPNGKMKKQSVYKDGAIIGEPKEYNEQGELLIETPGPGEQVKTYLYNVFTNKYKYSGIIGETNNDYSHYLDTITIHFKLQVTYNDKKEIVKIKRTDLIKGVVWNNNNIPKFVIDTVNSTIQFPNEQFNNDVQKLIPVK